MSGTLRPMNASVEIEFGGEMLHLLAERAAWWPRARAIIVADLHLGKASTFRSAGVPLPEGHSDHDLQRLSRLIERHGADHVIILGDLLHARSGVGAATLDALAAFRARHPASALRVTLVRGNHDRSAGDPPATLGFDMYDEPCDLSRMLAGEAVREPTSLRLAHDPAAAERLRPGEHMLCGHLHPAVALSTSGGGRTRHTSSGVSIRPPCFWMSGRVCVLPAFGTFTGSHAVRVRHGDRVFAVGPPGENAIVEVRRGARASDRGLEESQSGSLCDAEFGSGRRPVRS